MGWIQLASAVLGLAKEIFRYLRKQEESDKECAIKVKQTTKEIKNARKTKNTESLEKSFARLGLAKSNKP